jgi:hypothetical protein
LKQEVLVPGFALALFLGVDLVPHEADGLVRYDTDWTTVYFESGGLPPARMERFVRLLDQGIIDIETYVGGSPPEAGKVRKVTYYVKSDIEISWSYRHTVLLPLERVQTDSAPYLHETTHILFPVRSGSLWFAEGFASYVQSYVSEHLGGYDGYVFSKGGNGAVEGLARRYLRKPQGQAVVSYVGRDGAPPDLYSDRWGVAAPFYVLSHSFVKFIIERAGLDKVRPVLRSPSLDEAIEESTGQSVEAWRTAWLSSLAGTADVKQAGPD